MFSVAKYLMFRRMIRCTFCLWALLMNILCTPHVESAVSSPKRTLLILVTLDGNETLQGFFIDPVLKQELETSGWKIEGRGIEEVSRQHFEAADAVVLLQEPYRVNLKGVQALRNLAPELDRYLRGGGGLLVIFDDRYFQVFDPVNELLSPYGASVVREAVVESNAANITHLRNDDKITVVRTRNINGDHPVTRGITSMAFPQSENGKDSYPAVLTREWIPLVRGEATSRSEDIWAANLPSSYPSEPVLIAAREIEKGKLIYFGAHSSLTFLHGSHSRWDDGYFLKEGMRKFFGQALDWLSKAPGLAKGEIPPLKGNPAATTEIKTVPLDQQKPIDTWKRGVIVLLEQEPASLEPWVSSLAGKLDWVALSLPEKLMPEEKDYSRWKEACRQASRPDFLAIPAATVLDEFQNNGTILYPTSWPIRRKSRLFNSISRELVGHPVLLSPNENPWPVENIGGFQGFPLVEYEGDHIRHLNLDTFRALQSEDWFMTPHVVFKSIEPEALAGVMEQQGYRTLVPSRNLEEVPLHLPFLFHNERNVAVSRGPQIRQAGLVGPGLVDDPWEGLYYLWKGPEDHARYAMDVQELSPEAEVRIYRDRLLWRRYMPGSKEWVHSLEFASTESLHSYWMEVWQGDTLQAISAASRSRNFSYWAHGGGDRMNLYHAVMRESPTGGVMVFGKRLTGYGGFNPNLGWGDTVAVRPAVDGRIAGPAGHEWGIPSGGIDSLRFSPQIQCKNAREFLVSKPRRIGYSMVTEDAAILHETVERKEGKSGNVRTVEPAEFIKAETTYAIPVWEPDGLVTVVVDTTITALQDLDLGKAPSVQLVEFIGRSPGSFGQVTAGNAAGKETTAIATAPTRHNGNWFLIHPDPLGAVLLATLDERDCSLTTQGSSKGPNVKFAINLDNPVWRKGEVIHVRYAFALLNGEEKDAVEIAGKAVATWRGNRDVLQLQTGNLQRLAGYAELFTSGTGWISGSIAPGDRVVPLLCKIDGASERLPAYGQLGSATWTPLGQEDASVYLTIPTPASGSFRAGRLLNCSNPEIQVDVKEISARQIELWVHNPTLFRQTGKLEESGLIPCAPESPELSLQPGEEKLLSFARK